MQSEITQEPTTEKLETPGFLLAHEIKNKLTAKRLEELNTEYRWLFDISTTTLARLGFKIVNGQLGIVPISIRHHMEFLGLKYEPYLVHYGFYSSRAITDQDNGQEIVDFDNLTNLRKHKVWGSPDSNVATFLKPSFSRVVPNPRNGEGRKLFIDLKILQRSRRIYPDPEMFIPFGKRNFNGVEFDMPGHAFIVFGGISIDAIRHHEDIKIREMNQ